MQLLSQERPQPDPLLPHGPSGGLRSTGSSRSAALPGAGPLSATQQTPGALPLEEGLSSSCLPQEQRRSLPLSAALYLRCLLETPTEGGHLPGSEGAASGPGMLSHCSGVRVFPEKHPDSWVILGMEAGS